MRPKLEEMTLREKIGQTGMPSPTHLRDGVLECGSYAAYFKKYPFCGFYMSKNAIKPDGEKFSDAEESCKMFDEANKQLPIPLLIAGDCEFGASRLFSDLHTISSNMSLGAARKGELAYKRSYYWAREMRSAGVNWPFGPVVDLHTNFFATSGIRRIGKDPALVAEIVPYIIKGIHDAGCATSAKHFPGASNDYRDSHFSPNVNTISRERWYANDFKVWKAAVDAGAMSLMTSHSHIPAFDNSCARGDIPRPATASKKIIDLARVDLQYDGVMITDAVNMKSLAAAFEHDDIYIECFLAGHDMILFTDNDYIDVMEKAVLDGRITEAQIDEACRRVLDLKEKIGLFDDKPMGERLTEEEIDDFEQTLYNVAKNAMTLITNRGNMIPFDAAKVKRVTIINVAPDEQFQKDLVYMKEAFERRGIEVEILERLRTKAQLKAISESSDIIVYACYLASSRPIGMSVYSRPMEMNTLFHSLSYGATKSVCVSFGSPSIYYNYFECADAFINAYSDDKGTFQAFVDGILGEFPFVGKSPVPLRPVFAED